jgi:CheY-like chemotaxis protein
MPTMNGLDVLDELVDWPGSRMLLTGQADEQIAVSAFNRGLIDQFIAKQSADISHRLIDAVARLVAVPSARHAQIWRGTLTPEQNALLRVPSVNNELGEFVESRWIEYVVIGDPFGVLGIDSEGHVGWLQLETEAGLHDLSDIATAEGLDIDTVEDIRAGRKLVNLELRQALGRDLPVERHPAFSLGRNEKLLGALFTLPAQFCPAPANSYAQWLARQGQRTVLR